jgi:mono/diheme cytochrome c family protein
MAERRAMHDVEQRGRARGLPGRGLALPALACLLASGCAVSGPVAGPTAGAAAPESGRQVLGRVCAPCHTRAGTDRPVLTGAGPSSTDAARALRAVMAREMPPRSSAELSVERRDALISFLCERSGRGESYCQAIAHRDPRPPIRAAPTFFQSIGRVTSREVPAHLREMAYLHTDPDASRVVLTPSATSLVIVVAAAVCAGDTGSAGADAAELGRCIRRVLQLGITPVRPPAGSGPRP